MYQKKLPEENLCPFEYALSLIGGKWDIRVICLLAHNTSLRYGQFKKMLPDISDTALSGVLKKLLASDMVVRHAFNEVPPHVEYRLSARGLEAVPILQALCRWSVESKDEKVLSKLKLCEDCRYGITASERTSYNDLSALIG
ncbi:MAG: helix-turn-helix transcriptional regulator [Eubacterium sp.]|nr:helix-turn-helix transcriptional regulator [Eubacterium sp.]